MPTFLADRNVWLRFVDVGNPREHKVHGKKAHDAKLAAAVLAYQIDFFVTFNIPDFTAWPINVLHPADVASILKP